MDTTKTQKTINDTLIPEKINTRKIKGKFTAFDLFCSRTYTIQSNHRIKYRGGCEGNQDTRKKGKWTIKNDTLIITQLFSKEKKWILVGDCWYDTSSTVDNLIGCLRKE